MTFRTRHAASFLAALATVVIGAGMAACGAAGGSVAKMASGSTALTVSSSNAGRALPNGFLGVSIEFRGLEDYVGANPAALDPVFVQLLRNLAPGQSPVLRIGGDSTDWSWWPVPGVTPPGGIKYSLNQRWMQVAQSLAKSLGARLLLGVNFEADNRRIAAAEASAMTARIGARSILAFELGNEPELYGSFSWY